MIKFLNFEIFLNYVLLLEILIEKNYIVFGFCVLNKVYE